MSKVKLVSGENCVVIRQWLILKCKESCDSYAGSPFVHTQSQLVGEGRGRGSELQRGLATISAREGSAVGDHGEWVYCDGKRAG